MKPKVFQVVKVVLIFIMSTFLFYYGLRAMHLEYEQLHRYDKPDGPAMKVFNEEDRLLDRFHLFFRLD